MVDNYAAIMYSHCFALGLAFGEIVIAGFIWDSFGFYSSCMSITVLCTICGGAGAVHLYRHEDVSSNTQQTKNDAQLEGAAGCPRSKLVTRVEVFG